MTELPTWVRPTIITLSGFLFVAIVSAGYGTYYFLNELSAAKSELASTTAASQQALVMRDEAITSYKDQTDSLTASLQAETAKNNAFGAQVQNISATVSNLTKLSGIDLQLLAKYSKIYFLNENYIPAKLSDIPQSDTTQAERTYQFESDALPFLTNMISDASSSGINLQVSSAYRSFTAQKSLKSTYKVKYGTTAANSFSADQGYSEHQLGTAVDFSTKALGGGLTGFDKDPAYAWLNANAHRYGFILSYPTSNAYYIYEPWHWRFVGVILATDLHTYNKRFYDLDQRAINTYLGSLFDQ
jgi:LAS superfamily LD-carboxypeptidase LdcB